MKKVKKDENEPQKENTMKLCKPKCHYRLLLCIIMIVCNLLFMPQSMVIKQFNLDYSMF